MRVAPILAWLARLPDGSVARKNTSTTSTGGKGLQPRQTTTTTTYSIDGVLLMWGRGVCALKTLWAGTDILYSTGDTGAEAFYQAEAGVNTLTGSAVIAADADASGGQSVEIVSGGQVAFNSVVGADVGVILYFYYKSTAPTRVEMRWNGNFFTDTLPSTGGVYAMGYHSAPYQIELPTGNVIRVKNIGPDAVRIDRLGVRAVTSPTGVPNVNIDPDDDYDALFPPDAEVEYTRPTARYSGGLIEDGDGGLGGTIVGGNFAGITHHDGRDGQLPDAVVESAIDAEFGEGSTPAYRGRPTTCLSNFFLTRYQEVFPPMSAVLEHKTIRDFDQCCAHWCERAGLGADDYDFSAIPGLHVRGLVVNPPYEPKGIMQELGRIFNVYFTDTDKIRAFPQDGASVVTIDDSELGWLDDAPGEDEPLPELGSEIPVESELPRRVTLRFYDPARNYEQNAQSDARQITTGEREELVDVQLTMTPDEARAVAARELYQAEVEAVTHRFNLSYEYLYLNPGDIITVTRDEGFTHSIRLTSINYSIGVLECEGYAVDTAVYEQPAAGVGGTVFESPPVPIPAMSVLGIYDGPLLRDNENSVNNGAGFYAYALKRTGDGAWNGASLYVDRGRGWELLETFEVEATAGRTADDASGVLTASTDITAIVADPVTVDLYGTAATLEGATDDELLAGANPYVIGDEVCNGKGATKVAGFSNRWDLTVGLRARRGTAFAVDDHLPGERFFVANSAVKFIPIDLAELNVERPYKLVTAGQSLDDAATVLFAWTGGGLLEEPQPANGAYYYDAHNNLYVTWDPGARPADMLAEVAEVPRYKATARSVSFSGTVTRGPVPVEIPADLQAAWEQFTLLGFPCTVPPTTEADGTVSHVGSATEVGCVMNSQVIKYDCEIFFEVGAKFPPRSLHLINHPSNTTTEVYWETTQTGGVPTLKAGNTGVTMRAIPGRYGIRVSRRQAEFIGPPGQVVARSEDVPLLGEYRLQAVFGLLGGEAQEAKRVTIRPSEPEVFMYTADQMAADGLTPGVDTVYVEIVAVSNKAWVGDSDPLQIACVP